jgi:hypothetical protein
VGKGGKVRFRRFYNVREELPLQYELVMHTDAPTPALGTEVIVTARSQ